MLDWDINRALRNVEIEISDGAQRLHVQDPGRLLANFESVGDGCELGNVQRFSGIEPVGLFRFSSLPYEHFMMLLTHGFEIIDEKNDVDVFMKDGADEWWGRLKKFGIEYHTGRSHSKVSEAEMLKVEPIRIAFTKRKFLEELDRCEKIFVRTDILRSSDEMRRAYAALQKLGPIVLLWIAIAETPSQIGTVQKLDQRFYKGFIENTSALAAPSPSALSRWLVIAQNALELSAPIRSVELEPVAFPAPISRMTPSWECKSKSSSTLSTSVPPPAAGDPVVRHELLADSGPLDNAVLTARLNNLEPRAVYCFSLRLWISSDFDGYVETLFPGTPTLRRWPIDLSLRDRWQDEITSVKLPGHLTTIFRACSCVARLEA